MRRNQLEASCIGGFVRAPCLTPLEARNRGSYYDMVPPKRVDAAGFSPLPHPRTRFPSSPRRKHGFNGFEVFHTVHGVGLHGYLRLLLVFPQ